VYRKQKGSGTYLLAALAMAAAVIYGGPVVDRMSKLQPPHMRLAGADPGWSVDRQESRGRAKANPGWAQPIFVVQAPVSRSAKPVRVQDPKAWDPVAAMQRQEDDQAAELAQARADALRRQIDTQRQLDLQAESLTAAGQPN